MGTDWRMNFIKASKTLFMIVVFTIVGFSLGAGLTYTIFKFMEFIEL